MSKHDESVYKVLHFKKRGIAGGIYNLVKRTEIMCEQCLSAVAADNAKHPGSWDLVVEEEIIGIDVRSECYRCRERHAKS